MSTKLSRAAVLVLIGVPLALGQESGEQKTQKNVDAQQEIGYKSAQDAEQRKTLLLKDFKPVFMLLAPVDKVDRAKYYVLTFTITSTMHVESAGGCRRNGSSKLWTAQT
jgi:hypothetical protein